MRVFLLASILLSTFMVTNAHAAWPDLSGPIEADKRDTNDVAVIVAVEDYLLLPDVPGAVENANDWEMFLRRSLGVKDVHVLANQDASREEMLKFAKIAANDVGDDGRIWWVFIGHGAPTADGKDGLLVGMDAQQTAESLQARGVRQAELMAALETESHEAIVILDACFSGRASDGSALAAGVQPVVAVESNPRLGSDSVVLTAAKATEVAGQLPGTTRPAFSYLMLGALRGWADDGDGRVTAEEALYYARRELRGVKGRQQTPQMEGNSSVILSSGVSEPAPDVVIKAGSEAGSGVGETTVDADGESEAQRKLTYLNRRVVYDGSDFRQNDRVLDAVPFYHAVNRPDLAEEFKTHTPWMWITGAVMTAAGIGLIVWGFSAVDSETSERDTGRFLGGFMGGFFTMSGGIALFTVGLIRDQHPLSLPERESLAQQHNRELRDSMNLGPEADTPVERRKDSSWWSPFSMAPPRQTGIQVTIRF